MGFTPPSGVRSTWCNSTHEEAHSGADFAVVVTLHDHQTGRRVKKVMLVQAKIAPASGTAPYASDLLRDEISAMLSHTSEAYVLGYSGRTGVVAYDAKAYAAPAQREAVPFEVLVVDSVDCRRGDRSRELLRYAEQRPRLNVDVEG
jgi:hypothetical protein